MKLIECSIKGSAPLLMHRFSGISETVDKNMNDEQMAELVIYKTPDNKLYQPGEHIERSLQKAGTQFKYKGKKTYLDFIKAGVYIKPDILIHKKQKWEPDKRAVVIQRSRILRVRPRLDEWELDFTLEIVNKDIEVKKISEILIYAGQFVGIGDYRPKFGRFIVTKFDYE